MATEINLLATASGFGTTVDAVIPWQSDSDSTVFGKATPAQVAGVGATIEWGDIEGTLSDQTDLQSALDAKVDEGAVTTSGLTMATARILGRTTASTGAIEEISIGSGLSLSAGSLSATGGGSGDVTGPVSSTTGNLASFGDTSGDVIADSGIAAANVVTAAANIADGNLAEGNAAKGLEDSGIAKADVVTAASNLTVNQLVVGNGTKGLSTLAAGTNTHVLTMVAGVPTWQAGGSGDVVGPASSTDGRVALFDLTTGKLIKQSSFMTEGATGVTFSTNLLSVNNSLRQVDIGANAADAVIIGNAASATVAIGNASGGGTTFAGTATFNGALLSPGTGTTSTKIGPSATASGTNGISIGNSAATGTGSSSISIGTSTTCGNAANAISIGTSASAVADAIAIGRITAAFGTNSICIGYGTGCSHNGAVAIGRSAAGSSATSAAADDFVFGVAAHNYKFPGTIITDLNFRTTTGTKIGTSTSQLIGFWNATPVDQPAAVADATDNPSAITQLNALLARLREIGLIAT